jgi:hypothetical protein
MWGPASYAHQKPRSRNGQESDHAGGAPRLERAEQAIPAAHPNDAELNLDAQVLGWVLRELAGHWHTECGYTALFAETVTDSGVLRGAL